uniref:Protein C10 n=2 Tax=Oxyrrhis marina TaxID=2969 RepID=A0A7S3XJE3_OXYMA
MAQQWPTLTAEQAEKALLTAISEFKQPDNAAKLKAAVSEVDGAADPMQAMMMRAAKLIPMVQEILAGPMKEYGFEGDGAVMAGVAQIQAHAGANDTIKDGVAAIYAALGGNVAALENFKAGEVEEEVCD